MSTLRKLILPGLLSAALLIAISIAALGLLSIGHVAHATDQIDQFEMAVANARHEDATAGHMIGALHMLIAYYPSGTKHEVGSHVDKLVEFGRETAIQEVICRLRLKTGLDLGSRPEAWIEHYENKKGP